MTALVLDHAWRPPHKDRGGHGVPAADRPCEYMNCRRHRAEHARAVSGRADR